MGRQKLDLARFKITHITFDSMRTRGVKMVAPSSILCLLCFENNSNLLFIGGARGGDSFIAIDLVGKCIDSSYTWTKKVQNIVMGKIL